MRPVRRSAFVRYFLLPFSLTLWLSACQRWVQAGPPSVELPTQASMPFEDRDELRLHLDADRTVEGTLEELTADSVVLVKYDSRAAVYSQTVLRVDTRKTDGALTVLGVIGGAALTVGAVAYISALADCSGCD